MRGGWRDRPGSRARRRPDTTPESTAGLLDEIESLTTQNRRRRDPAVEQRLVRLRHDAFAELPTTPGRVWPPRAGDPFPGVIGIPEITATATGITATNVAGAIRGHGSLLVRGLLSQDRVARLVDDIDAAFDARAANDVGAADETDATYVRFEPGIDSPPLPESQRQWVRDCGAMWAADAPRGLFDVMEAYAEARLPEVLGEYLGEPPVLSVNKFTLRRVPPDANGAWHQDGSFLGEGVRTVAVWIALSECGAGTSRPGLSVVPRRVDYVLPTHLEDAAASIGVGPEGIVNALAGSKPVQPTFAPGDALIFDELLVHRTGGTPATTLPRYAVESWFFTPATFPPTYVPIVV